MREPNIGALSERDTTFFLQQLIRGRSNATGTVTLTASQATTTVTTANGNDNAQVLLFPTTANAAAELAAGTAYVSTVAAASFIVTHANNSQTDRTFGYLVIGG